MFLITKAQDVYSYTCLVICIIFTMLACGEDSNSTESMMNTMAADEDVVEAVDTVSKSLTYFKDIKPIIDAYCVDCHTDTGIAPFPLDSYDQVLTFIDPVQIAINQKTMPPWGSNDNGVPFKYDIRMKEAEIKLVNDWIEEGSIAGDLEVDVPPIILDKGGL